MAGNGSSLRGAPAWAPSDQWSAGGLEGLFLRGSAIQVRKVRASSGLIMELGPNCDKAQSDEVKGKFLLN